MQKCASRSHRLQGFNDRRFALHRLLDRQKPVIPAQAESSVVGAASVIVDTPDEGHWIPAFAGMTNQVGMTNRTG